MTKPSLRNVIRKLARKGITVAKRIPTEYGCAVVWSNGETSAFRRDRWTLPR